MTGSCIADRLLTLLQIRDVRARDHEVAGFLERIRKQSVRALEIYKDASGDRLRETQSLSTGPPNFTEFYTRLDPIRAFHLRNPNEPVENLERAYKRRAVGEDAPFAAEVDTMFTGEEAFGKFFDLMAMHEQHVNLPGVKRRLNYLQYLDNFDNFDSIPRPDKMREEYFSYVNSLAAYLESYMRRIKPLNDLDNLFAEFDQEFEEKWENDDVAGWKVNKVEADGKTNGLPKVEGTGTGVWCADCEKEFGNENVWKSHLNGKKHMKNAAARAAQDTDMGGADGSNGAPKSLGPSVQRLKERAVAEREYRIKKLVSAMQTERSDTRVNVERKQGMTDKERAQELQAIYNEATDAPGAVGLDDEEDKDDKIYNPLKLPLAWDGKPIPFWLYKLHGLGVEFPCEICGNFVYMGRRAFDKHFSEPRHLYGLKCLGITNSSLFREITGMDEAKALWDKIQKDKKEETSQTDNVIQMEDSEGNVMPEKVYWDLQKQGLL